MRRASRASAGRPEQQRNADEEQQGPEIRCRIETIAGKRLPDGEQIEVDRAGFNGGAVERGHRGQNP